jgi:drug/metabolite transporter (DMT)-like permease
VQRAQLVALAVSYAGVLLVFGHEVTLAGADVVLGAALVFGSALSYAVYLVYSGEHVKRLGALRLTGWASSVACVLCIVQFLLLRPLSAALVAPEVMWLSVLNATPAPSRRC